MVSIITSVMLATIMSKMLAPIIFNSILIIAAGNHHHHNNNYHGGGLERRISLIIWINPYSMKYIDLISFSISKLTLYGDIQNMQAAKPAR